MQAGSAGGSITRTDQDAGQEFQLETRHLVFLIALVVVLCVASFMLGRWVERQSLGPTLASGAGSARGAPDAKIEDVGDVSKDLTFFDTLTGNEPAPLRPDTAPRATREVSAPPARAAEDVARAATAGGAGAPPAGSASGRRSVNDAVMIQVLVSKDRAAADNLRRRLRAKGYTVVLVPDRGSYKVRVGPYADREEAERVAGLLREQEHLSTWIP
jgi:cell division protein FtsN